MLAISIHISLPTSGPLTPEQIIATPIEKVAGDNQSNTTSPILTVDKDITLGSLLTARCCFGIASINDSIYVVGMYIYTSHMFYRDIGMSRIRRRLKNSHRLS
jgi:hypothetical protein